MVPISGRGGYVNTEREGTGEMAVKRQAQCVLLWIDGTDIIDTQCRNGRDAHPAF